MSSMYSLTQDDNDGLFYTELSHIKSGKEKKVTKKSVEEQPESDEMNYADITHVIRSGETTYENVASQNENVTYANVVEMK